MVKTKLSSIILVLIVTLFTSVAQIFYKFGADKLDFSIFGLITNYHLIIGLGLYGLGAVILITALRGGELTVLYPIIATSYIWVSVLSIIFLNEEVSVLKWIGILAIVVGVSLVAGFSKKDSMEFTEAL